MEVIPWASVHPLISRSEEEHCGRPWRPPEGVVASEAYFSRCRADRRAIARQRLGLRPLSAKDLEGKYFRVRTISLVPASGMAPDWRPTTPTRPSHCDVRRRPLLALRPDRLLRESHLEHARHLAIVELERAADLLGANA